MKRTWWAGLVALALCIPATTGAEPLIPAGDGRLRQDVQLLQGAGLISGPVDGYPLTWAQLTAADLEGQLTIPPHVAAAALRLLGEHPPGDGLRVESTGGFTGDRTPIYDYHAMARTRTDVSVAAQKTWGATTLRLAAGVLSDEDLTQVVLDGSYLSHGFGNWTLYGGAVDRWYGPGGDAGLVQSRNARPVPGVGILRSVPRRSESSWVRWMGPWRLEAFLGVLTGDREDFARPLLFNMQLAMQPWPRFNLSLNRGIQICGEGRPCGADTWLKAFLGAFDLDNPGDDSDASNQGASVAMSYRMTPGALQVVPVLEVYLEDEFTFVSVLLGGRISGPVGSGHAWHTRLEYSDTYANRVLGALHSGWWVPTPSVTYDHYIYTGGYTHRGDGLGHPIGTDGKLGTVEARFVERRGATVAVRYRHAYVRTNPAKVFEPVLESWNEAAVEGQVVFGPHRAGLRARYLGRDGWTLEAVYRIRVDLGG